MSNLNFTDYLNFILKYILKEKTGGLFTGISTVTAQ